MKLFNKENMYKKIGVSESLKSMHLHLIILLVLLFVVIVGVVMFSVFDRAQNAFDFKSQVMGMSVSQTVNGKHGQEICEKTIKRIIKCESLLSCKLKDSEISKINSNAGGCWSDVTDQTLAVISVCKEMYEISDGEYDPTILAISSLWKFEGNSVVPSQQEIMKALSFVDGSCLKINEDVNRVKLLKKGVALDLSDVQRGAACSVAVDAYREFGAESGIVSVGESVGVYGIKKNGKMWNIALRDPLVCDDSNDKFAVLKVRSGFVSTTGSYQKKFIENEKFYHNVISSQTGYPVASDLVSVTVQHKDGVISDLLSKVCFIIGRDRSESLLNKYGAGAIFVDNEKKVYVTENIKKEFTLTEDSYSLRE